MGENLLAKLFEHNNWANMQIIQACYVLSDEQLDAEPHSATQGSIRSTLIHLVSSQHGYLKTLTLPVEERRHPVELTFAGLEESARVSGEGLLTLFRDESGKFPQSTLRTRDDFYVEPWVLIV